MNGDRVAGTARNVGGKVQEGFGRATGDVGTQAEGMLNQAAGTAQDLYGQAKAATSDAVDSAVQGATDAGDFLRRTIEERPYTAALIALGVGWLIGRMGRRD